MLLLVRLVVKVVGEIPLTDEQGGAAVVRNKGLDFTHEWQCGLYKASLIKDNGIGFVDELIKAQDIVFFTEVLLKKTTPLAFVNGGLLQLL